MDHTNQFLTDLCNIKKYIDAEPIEKMVKILEQVRARDGRLFILGIGGGAGNASHAVNDFRKIAGIDAYAPTDNVSELTARINDDGWGSVFANWLKISRLYRNDCIMVFSVGGGNEMKGISMPLVYALKYAVQVEAKVIGIVGKDGGYTKRVADACLVIPTVNEKTITPLTEAYQSVIWHLMVSHPALQKFEMKWESTK
jgi:D-sedoheptulose 7-phosphate isomerase